MFVEDGVLLDWGTRGRGRDERVVFQELLDRFRPDILVLEDGDAAGSEKRARMRHLLRTMARNASEHGITVRKVSRSAVRRSWAEQGHRNKRRVAMEIGVSFPEIAPYVPRQRRAWESEDPRAGVFDALSLVLYGTRVGSGRESAAIAA